ncbi:piRNA biogenesis protein EXD1 (Exonuclease 3'-5' domain-containing protein 1) (Exonuclease 3'-5' domain-like-containing protein 1) (Inactive exonuclease EXD1) (mExd1) [Durusdinium trenchii]|uniref:PiRNA biogenesis protein EXD1 (Exonuclease 3'-5' domain-containing protein 1) (Exonuclease 3'-5' domain-like-containing protein 1) (Inactive exonuclease EXD1) (MExd1) n=1 Tax=Durusdinium trenchii TaxID=1381693 RepID=A0ABP0KVN1_9DINO
MNVPYELINCVERCREVVVSLLRLREVAVDLEGLELCRSGKGCIIQVATPSSVMLFDITDMGPAAFTNGRLKELLEGPVCKVLCDGRGDSHALHTGYGIQLASCYDLKFSRESDRFIKGFYQILESAAVVSECQLEQLKAVKDAGRGLFSNEAGGSEAVWEERPLRQELLEYAAADVAYLLSVKQKWSSYSLDGLVRDRTCQCLEDVICNGWTPSRDNAFRDFSLEGGEVSKRVWKSRARGSLDLETDDEGFGSDYVDDYEELLMEYGEAVAHVASASGLEGKALRDYAEWLEGKDW